MRTIPFLQFFVALMISLVVLSCDSGAVLQEQPAAIEKQYLTLASFDTLEIHDNLQVMLTQADKQEIMIEGLQKQLAHVSAVVSNGKLVLRKHDSKWQADDSSPINISIIIPSLKYIYFKGYGMLKSQDSLRFENLTIAAIDAFGTVSLAVDNRRLHIISNSSVALQVAGNTELFYCSSFYNDGMIDASGLNARSASCYHHGESTIELKTSQSLKGEISNVGNLKYYGNPSTIEVEITGKGKLIHAK